MAGDWIKMDVTLPEKPEVIQMAAALERTEYEVVGMLHRTWAWFDTHTSDGNAAGVTSAFLDRYIGVTGWAVAMGQVGWLVIGEEGLTMPEFDEHNGISAKKRAQTAKRVKRCRNAPGVTKALPEKEKSKNISTPHKPPTGGKSPAGKKPKRFEPPTVEEVQAYCRERGNGINPKAFWEFYQTKGWVVGKSKMKDWQAAVRHWEERDKDKGAPNQVHGEDELAKSREWQRSLLQ